MKALDTRASRMDHEVERTYQGFIFCRGYKRTWSFPQEVIELLRHQTHGQSVLQMYGGLSSFGTTMDADPSVHPQVIGNALFPPFGCESFDTVIVDPPYKSAYNMQAIVLLSAACVARSRVWWFHTHFAYNVHSLRLLRWWVILTGRKSPSRVLMEFERTKHPKLCTLPPGYRTIPEIETYNWSRELGKYPLWIQKASTKTIT